MHSETGWWRGLCREMRHEARLYWLKEWPSAVLVAALVFIIHHQFHWLDAIDGYAFLGIGHEGFVERLNKPKRVVAVLIDQAAHETRYREQSPLSRCQLHRDLKRLYAAKPSLVAIDLDISPANWLIGRSAPALSASLDGWRCSPAESVVDNEADCEEKLYCMIKDENDTTTVIMKPFDVSPSAAELKRLKEVWMTKMKLPNVRFGIAEVPVRYGLVIKQYGKGNDWFAAQVRNPTPESGGEDDDDKEFQYIDPRGYAEIDPIPLSTLDTLTDEAATAYLEKRLNDAFRAAGTRVAFFGGAYGQDDRYLTPIGEVYGVEVQAAAYLSEGLGQYHWLDLFIDIVIAFFFGIVIALCWHFYFTMRTGNIAWKRQVAPLVIVLLVVCVLIIALLALWISLQLLARYGIWSSPIPIGIGMLIDSFVSGSIEKAVYTIRRHEVLVEKLRNSDLADVHQILKNDSIGFFEPKNFRESVWHMIYGGVARLKLKKQKFAARLLVAWTLVWFAAIGYAIFLALH